MGFLVILAALLRLPSHGKPLVQSLICRLNSRKSRGRWGERPSRHHDSGKTRSAEPGFRTLACATEIERPARVFYGKKLFPISKCPRLVSCQYHRRCSARLGKNPGKWPPGARMMTWEHKLLSGMQYHQRTALERDKYDHFREFFCRTAAS